MSHEVTEWDSLFVVRKPAWHGLGHTFEEYPTREQAKAKALPWEPETQPVYRREIVVTGDRIEERYVEVKGVKEVTRSDTHAHLGVITDSFERSIVSNETLFDIAEAIQGSGADVKYETGGSLKGGRKVWLLLRLNEPLVVKGDPHGETLPYYALQNAHDGSAAFRGQALMTRIVCDNTAHVADVEASARGTEFVFRHTSGIHSRIEQAKRALAGWRNSIEAWARMNEHLLGLPVTPVQSEDFVQIFVPMPPAGMLISDRVRDNIEMARSDLRKILLGPTCADVAHTAYGLVQAATEYSQWYRATRGSSEQAHHESRFNRSYLTRSRLTADAVLLAQQVANS